MSNLLRSGALSLLAGGLASTALLLPTTSQAQEGAPRIIKRTVETVEVLDDGPGYRNRQVYLQPNNQLATYRPSYRQAYVQPAPAPRTVVVRQPGYQEPGYEQLAYGRPYRQAYAAPVTVVEAQQQEKSCQIGRLVGGLVGGGIGYAASRQDGRAWAVPLGALLGTQAGCNTAVGKGPTLW